MVSRIPPPDDGSPVRPPRTTGAVALITVLAVVVGIWLINGRDPGTPTSAAVDTSTPAAPAAPGTDSPGDSTPSAQPSQSASPSATSSPTPVPSEPSSAAPLAPPSAPPSIDPASGLPTVYLLDLPPEAAETVESIDRGPPFPYSKDGSTFGNYEGLLPDFEPGYYQEFTVETPGSYDRGARRIVEGADSELYWTSDHYASFSRILL